jgi:hypothetical protein
VARGFGDGARLMRASLFYVDARLLGGHVHSLGAKALLGFVLLCGFALSAAAGVVRQVFAVELRLDCLTIASPL